MKKVLLVMIVFFLGLQSICFSVGPPNYLPDGVHPRIWLTTAELTKLNAKQSASAAEWTALESWCDTHLGDTGYDAGDVGWQGYRGNGYMKYLLNFALAYQVLKDDNPTKALTYAQYVRDILVLGVYESMSSGDELNGLALVRCGEESDRTINAAENAALGLTYGTYKLGYSSRNIAAVPIAYDWIHEAGVLSAADKAALSEMMYRWFDWTRGVRSDFNDGVLVGTTRYYEDTAGDCSGNNNCTDNSGTTAYGYTSVINNFGGGHIFMMTLVPVATYGDHADAASYLTASKSYLTNTVIADLGSDLKSSGGDSSEGWNYGSSFWSTLQGLYGHYTATGQDIFNGFDWPKELVEALLHRSQSDLKTVPIYGDWTGLPLGENRKYQALPFIGIGQRLYPSEEVMEAGQYLLDNTTLGGVTDEWVEALWYDGNFTATHPTVLPLAHRAIGTGFVTSRSSWTDAISTNHFSIRLEGKLTNSHENYDEGTFTLTRGTDRLLAHKNMTGDSVSTNSIVFNDTNHHAENPALSQPAIDRYENTAAYMYVSGDITNAWQRTWKTDGANLVRRSALHLRPGIVVLYDVTQSNPAVGNLKEWYTQYEADPTAAGDTITVTNGNSKAFVKTLYPAGGTYTKTTPSAGFWRVKYTPAVEQEYGQFLTVLEATSSSQGQMTPVEGILSPDGKMRGSYIQHSITPWVVLFSADQDGRDVLGDISYTIETSQERRPKHILLGLPPNTRYKLRITDSRVFSLTVDATGNHVSSNQGVLTFGPPVFKQGTLQRN